MAIPTVQGGTGKGSGKSAPSPLILCVTSGKGGVGKTSLTVNLGIGLSRSGLRVLIVDGDLGLANVDLMLGMQVAGSVRDVLETGADPKSTLAWPENGLAVLPAASGVPEMVTLEPEEQERLEQYLLRLVAGFHVVLLDTAAGIGPSVLWFNRFAHRNVVVMTPDPTAVTDAYALIKVLRQRHGRDRFHLVVNEVTSAGEGAQIFDNLARVAADYLKVTLELLGCVPRDPEVRRAVRSQRPFCLAAPKSPAATAVAAMIDPLRALIPAS